MSKESVINFPSNWIKRGYVHVHPNDRRVYPKEFTSVDPETFTASVQEPGQIVSNWGLDNPRTNKNGSAIDWTEHMNMYGTFPSPYEQYISILARRKLRAAGSPEIQEACKNTLRIKIWLEFNESDVWREFLVPASTSLAVFHDRILSAVMGWARGYHGYVFEDHHDGAILGAKKFANYVDVKMWAQQVFNAHADDRQFPLGSILREVGDTCKYTYDLGDRWSHILRVEEVLDPVKAGKLHGAVALINGHGGCPPEDSMCMGCHGSYEYPQFLARYKKASPSVQKKIEKDITQKAMNYELTEVPIPFHPIKYNLAFQRELLRIHVAGHNVVRNNEYLGEIMFPSEAFGGAPCAWSIPCLENDDKCAACLNKLKVLMHCARCRKVLYCSRECQTSDWKRHKKLCKAPESEGAAKTA